MTLLATVALDQATKAAVVASVDRGEQINVFFGLDLTYTRNSGVAFGLLTGAGTAVAVLIALALGFLLVYFARHARVPLLWLPVGAVLGGAIGNLVDRLRDGTVVDFIDPVAWPAFNLADTAIVLGVAGLLYLSERGREERRSPA